MDKNIYWSSLFGGGMAGLIVDVSLFPLDTIKTRLQCAQGFWNSGGFKCVYKGLGPQVIASAPQAALFFCTYECFKEQFTHKVSEKHIPLVHMTGASLGEVVSCIVRVPMEVVKQRKQTFVGNKTSWNIAKDAYQNEGIFRGLYRGFGSTVIREVPFSFIQMPILEYLKDAYRIHIKHDRLLEPWEVANCGAVAGAISAAVTTPLDVIKTRIMLAESENLSNMAVNNGIKYTDVVRDIYYARGIKGFFSGFTPRVIWITIGGYIFFGIYDFSKHNFYEHVLKKDYDHQ